MPKQSKPATAPAIKPQRAPRTPRTAPPSDSFAAHLSDTLNRLHLDEVGAAHYLGVPVHTVRKWLTGERQPSSSVVRLLEVLGMLEALAPELHASLLP